VLFVLPPVPYVGDTSDLAQLAVPNESLSAYSTPLKI